MTRTVAFVASTLARVGPINVLREVLTYLDSDKYRGAVVTLSPELTTSRIEEFRASGIPVQQLNMSRVTSFVAGRQKLKRAIESSGADILHCNGFRADLLAASAGLACPLVSTLHSDLPCDYGFAYGRLAGGLIAHREYRSLRKFHAVIAVSEGAAERASQFGVTTTVIPNGINLAVYTPARGREHVKDVRMRLGWPTDRFILLHTGVLRGLKRPLEAIGAFRRSSAGQSASLIFAGTGPLFDECNKAAEGSTNISFIGHRSDMPDLLRAADAVISNSVSEGLPHALLEACACGLRVLASDIEPHRYISSLFPEQVNLFPVEDCAALTERLNDLSRSPHSTPFAPPPASLRTISAERMSSSYQDVYDRVLSGT